VEFVDVVMKRRAVRRFEEGGVDRDVIERIARLAQRAPSAGFSQGQRVVIVTDPDRRRRLAELAGEAESVYALMNTNAVTDDGRAQGAENARRLAEVLRGAGVDATGTG